MRWWSLPRSLVTPCRWEERSKTMEMAPIFSVFWFWPPNSWQMFCCSVETSRGSIKTVCSSVWGEIPNLRGLEFGVGKKGHSILQCHVDRFQVWSFVFRTAYAPVSQYQAGNGIWMYWVLTRQPGFSDCDRLQLLGWAVESQLRDMARKNNQQTWKVISVPSLGFWLGTAVQHYTTMPSNPTAKDDDSWAFCMARNWPSTPSIKLWRYYHKQRQTLGSHMQPPLDLHRPLNSWGGAGLRALNPWEDS